LLYFFSLHDALPIYNLYEYCSVLRYIFATMTSADFSLFVVTTESLVRPPQVRCDNLPLMSLLHLLCRIRAVFIGLHFVLQAYPSLFSLNMKFLFVSASVCLRLPSDSTSRWTPLPSANSSYCQACSGLSPPSYRPCWAHNEKGQGLKLPVLSKPLAGIEPAT